MDMRNSTILVLGGHGLVGTAVCRRLLTEEPRLLVVASRREANARAAADGLRRDFPDTPTRVLPSWGDVFLRAEWRAQGADARMELIADPDKRRRFIDDILDPLNEDITRSSLLAQTILGTVPELEGEPAHIVVDCMNTATGVAYQDIYATARRVADHARSAAPDGDASLEAERLLTALYVPQLVRHVQILYEAMKRAGTRAYVKVGTSGTGGLGFNIPYTHGEERPSRLLLSKAAVAGAQTMLTFLMARSPDGPRIVKEVKPTALIGWRHIGYGPIRRGGRDIAVYDCPPDKAVLIANGRNLEREGEFGETAGGSLQGVYIDTGENGLFSAAEFAAITAPGQMQLVTPEEIADVAINEIIGANTGREIVAALDASVMGPSFRGGHLRRAALGQLRQLETEHGESVAFEILGPPRLSKLLYEAYLLRRVRTSIAAVLESEPDALARDLEREIEANADLRRRIISIGVPILLADGRRMLRGPVIKSEDAHHGWVDLTPANMRAWQGRLESVHEAIRRELDGETSSRYDRVFSAAGTTAEAERWFDIGETAAWIFSVEDKGRRGKA